MRALYARPATGAARPTPASNDINPLRGLRPADDFALHPRERVLKLVADGSEAVHDGVEVVAGLVARDDGAGVVSQFLDLVHGLVSFLYAPGGSFHMQTL